MASVSALEGDEEVEPEEAGATAAAAAAAGRRLLRSLRRLFMSLREICGNCWRRRCLGDAARPGASAGWVRLTAVSSSQSMLLELSNRLFSSSAAGDSRF